MSGLIWIGFILAITGLLIVGFSIVLGARRKRSALDEFMGQEAQERALAQAVMERFAGEDALSLPERLVKAGLPFKSPAEYYSAMLGYSVGLGFLFALLGWVVSSSFLFAVVAGISGVALGIRQPDAQIKKAMRERTDRLFRDIYFGLPNLRQMFREYRNATAAIQRYVEEYHVAVNEGLPSEDREAALQGQEQAQATAEHLIANALRGAGGDLFAEALNRFSELLLRRVPPAEAAEEVKQYYPTLPDFDQVMTIVVQAVTEGIPAEDALRSIRATMRMEMERRASAQAVAAAMMSLAGATIQVLILVVLFAVPMLAQLSF